jgi:hypothetical protein
MEEVLCFRSIKVIDGREGARKRFKVVAENDVYLARDFKWKIEMEMVAQEMKIVESIYEDEKVRKICAIGL